MSSKLPYNSTEDRIYIVTNLNDQENFFIYDTQETVYSQIKNLHLKLFKKIF